MDILYSRGATHFQIQFNAVCSESFMVHTMILNFKEAKNYPKLGQKFYKGRGEIIM